MVDVQHVKKYFMKPQGSLPQEPVTGPYSEPDETSSYHHTPTYTRSILILSTYLGLCFPSDLFPSGFVTYIEGIKKKKKMARKYLAVRERK
jgi:hypothetical protein